MGGPVEVRGETATRAVALDRLPLHRDVVAVSRLFDGPAHGLEGRVPQLAGGPI